MIKLYWDAGFKRSFKKRVKGNIDLEIRFAEAIHLFTENPFDAKLRTHKLSGELKGLWVFSCAFDCRIVFEFIDNRTVVLIDIGTHDDVY
jgi:proteic killer suppression protein